MTTNKNRLRLDYKDMPDLKAALGGLEPGKRGSVEFKFMVSANADDYLEADIEEVEYDTEDSEDSESVSAEPTSETPIMVEVVRSSSRKPKPEAEEADDELMEDEE